ncbi:RNA demethylase ALKBH5-like protein [Tanacetum coccineum]
MEEEMANLLGFSLKDTDKNVNPPGIIRDEEVEALLPIFIQMIKRMVRWHILPPTCVPNSYIVNIYYEGDCIPPHIDHHEFLRPFCTISFLTQCNILFGSNLKIVGPGEFAGPFSIPLPVELALVLKGNGIDVTKHCVPAVPAKSNQVSSVRGGTMGRFINGSMGCSQIAGGLLVTKCVAVEFARKKDPVIRNNLAPSVSSSYIGHAIVAALTSGNKRFFVGTYNAPHDRIKKKCACGCAGVFNAHVVKFRKDFESQPFVKAAGNIFTGLSSLEEMYDMKLIL